MNMLVKAALSAALLVGTSLNALAVERGGILKYGRYADSLFLDPVLNDANVDIWILSNLYDTLILPTDDGKGLKPGLATDWKVSDDGLSVTGVPARPRGGGAVRAGCAAGQEVHRGL